MAKRVAKRAKAHVQDEMLPEVPTSSPAEPPSAEEYENHCDPVALPTEFSELMTDADKQRILLFGPPKIGKSTLASQFPKSIILDADDGYRWLRVKKIKIVKWAEVLDVGGQLQHAQDEGRDLGYRTIVFDSVESLYDMCFRYACVINKMDHPSDKPYGQGWQLIAEEFSTVVRAFTMMGLGVIFISNSDHKTVTDEFGKEVTIEQPRLPKAAEKAIGFLCDLILKMEVDRTVLNKAGDFTNRVLLPKSNPFSATGSRMSQLLDGRINATYKDLHQALKNAAVRICKERE